MNISVKWLNRYLDPDATPEEAERILTHAGFPLEGFLDTAPAGDVGLDLEVTSNRGDCLCHVGMAREIAACSNRALVYPSWNEPSTDGDVGEHLTLENRVPGVCPLFTAHVILGVRIGPSPDWLVEALESIGQRSISNVVDVTNFLNFELGQPSHVFDLAKLAGRSLVIRFAEDGEKLTTLDGKDRTLKATDLVVADAERAQSLAGVIGGAESEVGAGTTDIVLEAATWDPVTIRTAARRMAIRTDACHRFERVVDPRTIEFAARRAAAMICELSGGVLCSGMLGEGSPAAPPSVIDLRPARACSVIGIEIETGEMVRRLTGLEIKVEEAGDGRLRCTIPPFRPDLKREIDLIEEVARTKGYDAIPVAERMSVEVRHPQESERAMRELGSLLTGLGFYETITFSFASPDASELFAPEGHSTLAVDDERRKAEPVLRPSALSGLLACRRSNQDAGTDEALRLFETSAVFGEREGASTERRMLTLLADVEGVGRGKKPRTAQLQEAVRSLRGVVEAVARSMTGGTVDLIPAPPVHAGYDAQACASVMLGQTPLGSLGVVSKAALEAGGLDVPLVAAELELDPLVGSYPPAARVEALPAQPHIDRDVSLVVRDDVSWAAVVDVINHTPMQHLDAFMFVASFTGEQIPAGHKSITVRLRFRDPERTLRHEEVDPEVEAFVTAAQEQLGAEVRS
jgi:phenylalanyl-tRNA synthetase beta chain